MGVLHKSLDQSLRSRKETEAGARWFVDRVLNQLSSKLWYSLINHENEKSPLSEFEMVGGDNMISKVFFMAKVIFLYPKIPVPSSLLSKGRNNDLSYFKKCKIHEVLMAEPRLIPRALISGPFVCLQHLYQMRFGHPVHLVPFL